MEIEYQHQYVCQFTDDHEEDGRMVHSIWERYLTMFKNEKDELRVFPISLVSCPDDEWIAVATFTPDDLELIVLLFPEKYRTGKEYGNEMELGGVPLGFHTGDKQDALDGLADLILTALEIEWK